MCIPPPCACSFFDVFSGLLGFVQLSLELAEERKQANRLQEETNRLREDVSGK